MSSAPESAIWEKPATPPALDPHHIQVWRLRVQGSSVLEPDARQAIARWLPPAELQRMQRLQTPLARAEFAFGRVLLRMLLGRSQGLAPHRVAFSFGPAGKPESEGVHFNLSHSQGLVLLAMSRLSPVGVDVERVSSGMSTGEMAELVQSHFAAPEIAHWRKTDPARQHQVFMEYWTAKEAVLKAVGQGLRLPLQQVEIPIAPACPELPVTVGGGFGGETVFVRRIPAPDPYAEGGQGWTAALGVQSIPGIPARLLDAQELFQEGWATRPEEVTPERHLEVVTQGARE